MKVPSFHPFVLAFHRYSPISHSSYILRKKIRGSRPVIKENTLTMLLRAKHFSCLESNVGHLCQLLPSQIPLRALIQSLSLARLLTEEDCFV